MLGITTFSCVCLVHFTIKLRTRSIMGISLILNYKSIGEWACKIHTSCIAIRVFDCFDIPDVIDNLSGWEIKSSE
jgi:hypothetical protein